MLVIRTFTVIYALLSAALYCALMPPWEGFDELYHYGYVQPVSSNLTIPSDRKDCTVAGTLVVA